MKKGFTLIELLAVIVILAIILLIAMPIVLNVINEARKGAFNSTGFGLVKAAENEYMRAALGGATEATLYTFTSGVSVVISGNLDNLDYAGEGPESGTLTVAADGTIKMAISNGVYCVVKEGDSTDVNAYDETELGAKYTGKDLDDCTVALLGL